MQRQTRARSREASISVAPTFSRIDAGTYVHSPPHYAVACKDHAGLRSLLFGLPKPVGATDVLSEEDAIAEEAKAEALSAFIDSRDVPGRETPLHLAVRLGDKTAVEILMMAGADCSLQNENGWNSLQEAICTRQDAIARIIVKHYQRLGWAKWRRRLPRIVAAMNRMRDFYLELCFHFESSVIPFITRVAPSDTYRIWKRGPNLRTDMTLSGFDGLKIQRTGQTFLFLGQGSEDGQIPAGSLCMLDHQSKVIANAFEGADKELTDNEVAQEVSMMAQTNLYRPGIDVTEATLVPQLSWMWQEKFEIVHGWKAKVYDMHNVMLSMKTRQVPGAMTDEEVLQMLPNLERDDDSGEEYTVLLRGDQPTKSRVEKVSASSSKIANQDGHRLKDDEKKAKDTISPMPHTGHVAPSSSDADRKGWFGRSRRSIHQDPTTMKPGDPAAMNPMAPPRKYLPSEKRPINLQEDGVEQHAEDKGLGFQRGRRSFDGQRPNDIEMEEASTHVTKRSSTNKSRFKLAGSTGGASKEREFKKGLRPILWLTPDFPLKIEELLPLLDILANKVKAVRRLRELLTTKLPQGTFPVKIAFPLVPTIRVVVTFSKFEDIRANEEIPAPSSDPLDEQYQTSWMSWIKGPTAKPIGTNMKGHLTEEADPFAIPKDYKWNKPAVKKERKVGSKS